MRTQDYSPKINLPLVLPRWLLAVYGCVAAVAITIVWLAAVPAAVAALLTGGIVLFGVLSFVSAWRQYGGYLHYDGVHWYRQGSMQQQLIPKSAFVPWPSLVVLNFKGGIFTGPQVYVFTTQTLGGDTLRQLRVLLNTRHF